MTIVTVHEAKTHLSKLIAAAERGEEIVIARGDKPAVRLVPVEAAKRPDRVPGRLKGIIAFDDRFFDPLPEEDLRLWEGRGDDA
jgi:prevent-host-death family protein